MMPRTGILGGMAFAFAAACALNFKHDDGLALLLSLSAIGCWLAVIAEQVAKHK